MRIANPIYDTIIKYLLEDLVLAIEFFSFILGVKITRLDVQSQETSVLSPQKSKSTKLKKGIEAENPRTLYRLDFKATVLLANGKEKTILLEVQKTKRGSMLIRFRSYLGINYAAKPLAGYKPLELYCIYILGFPFGPPGTPPIVYNPRHLIDGLTGKLLNPDIELTFVNGLTHESCFININGFDENDDNIISKVWDMFNQKRKTNDNHFLEIKTPEAGSLMARIAKRLESAAADEQLQANMLLEDCYEMDLQEIEDQKEIERKLKDSAIAMVEASREREEASREREEASREREEDERRQKEEANTAMTNAIKSLRQKGQSVEEIAFLFGKNTAEIKKILGK